MDSGKKQPVLGTVAGAVVGFLVASVYEFLTNDPAFADQQAWSVILVIAAVCGFAAAMLGYFANCQIEGRTKFALIGLLTGTVAGIIGGAVAGDILAERVIASEKLTGDDIHSIKMSSYMRISYRQNGLCLGAIVGGVLGTGIGLSFRAKPNQIQMQNSKTADTDAN